MYVPNTFTPNGDENNNYFKPIINANFISEYSMMIFNRWGEMIFETHDLNTGWDGSAVSDNRTANIGVYTYAIRLKSSDSGGTLIYKGSVQLIR
ncbi:MAG: gliding motility-associated C-terminal domain-containing protein [Bacteroidetes bacterium]|nr:gliding motility-associated C-terminal domain-containing protein [Bacteroidota bacterium]